MSTRQGGCSRAPFASLNLGLGIGDRAASVAINRQRFSCALGGAVPVFLKQVHGARVVKLTSANFEQSSQSAPLEADAAVCSEHRIACTVLVADCLPVLFSAPDGMAVGAAHAGWRGLAAGVLEATLEQICTLAPCLPEQVQAWLGPCIGPRQFEVGQEVRETFRLAPKLCFKAGVNDGKYLADLPSLARWRLNLAGMPMPHLHGGTWCTVEDPSRLFSFRREGVTGRLAAAIWRVDGPNTACHENFDK